MACDVSAFQVYIESKGAQVRVSALPQLMNSDGTPCRLRQSIERPVEPLPTPVLPESPNLIVTLTNDLLVDELKMGSDRLYSKVDC
jgi:hypothetical protein